MTASPAATGSAQVRSQLVIALELDLIGPTQRVLKALGSDAEGLETETLDRLPSSWYPTGFLVPTHTDLSLRCDDTADDDFAAADGVDLRRSRGSATAYKPGSAGDDAGPSEQGPAKPQLFTSSIGVSVLLPPGGELQLIARWGDYTKLPGGSSPDGAASGGSGREGQTWQRRPRQEPLELSHSDITSPQGLADRLWPNSDGLRLRWHCRPAPDHQGYPAGTVAVTLFFTNERKKAATLVERDQQSAFQAELELRCPQGFVPRLDLQASRASGDWDEVVNALQFRDACEYGVGHNVGVEADLAADGSCSRLRTTWIPQATVEKVSPRDDVGCELRMEELDQLASDGFAAVRDALMPLVDLYRAWIDEQAKVSGLKPHQQATAERLLGDARNQAERIARGIEALAEPDIREAFAIANRVMAAAARQRFGVMQGRKASDPAVRPPAWRPFQLAFVLMNLVGIARPADQHKERDKVDLLFFPTGGGKTEAYLGLAAFTLVMRRLRHGGSLQAGGLSVLMRYTLRLLTLDQLGRASTLICALELERQRQPETLGSWPFEIGLWVGQAGTPNRMGGKGDSSEATARLRVRAYIDGKTSIKPIPIDTCPWCGVEFGKRSLDDPSPCRTSGVFNLLRQGRPDGDNPEDLRVACLNRSCAFTGNTGSNYLPLAAVDDMIYRRLPAFLIATVDKFASLPWEGRTGKLFGKATHVVDKQGYYGPADGDDATRGVRLGDRLDPPDLVIQDELHLISGPLGSMAGLYESVIDELCSRDGLRPKIVASTATVRRAREQMCALFGRSDSAIFPAPGPDRRDSFFAVTLPAEQVPGRLYVGLCAPGRNVKALLLRASLALMSGAQLAWKAAEKERTAQRRRGETPGRNPADPYMTLLGYFNTIKELGISRRLIEEELTSQLASHGERRRIGDTVERAANRKISNIPLELTSRVSTTEVSTTKDRLSRSFDDKDGRVDVALATNMISVGLDISRLGLMLMLGQPKTTAEYIQASSRVGRDQSRPGLVVVLLNPNRPRDRSHYEHFAHSHDVFYRDVEATSVTPFSERALERGLPAITVALARHLSDGLTHARNAGDTKALADVRNLVAEALRQRVATSLGQYPPDADGYANTVAERVRRIIDDWCAIAERRGSMEYGHEERDLPPLLRTPLDPGLLELEDERERQFKANRSLRDVEPSALLLKDRYQSTTRA
ncbi:MAG: DISARM system helicase DrmA [Prochlorococcaceae cyanobacterium]